MSRFKEIHLFTGICMQSGLKYLIFKDTIMIQNNGFLDFEKKEDFIFCILHCASILSLYLKKKKLNDESSRSVRIN